jgi:Rad3-related DNA helicase
VRITCDSIFDEDIVKKGIEEIVSKHSSVSRDRLNRESMSIKNIPGLSVSEKINALESVLKNVEENCQEILAQDNLQGLIDKKITDTSNSSELKTNLDSLRKLIPFNNNEENSASEYDSRVKLSKTESKVYKRLKSKVDEKELELIQALALLEDDEGNY